MQSFFSKNEADREDISSQVESLCKSLTYISETDAPIVYFSGPNTGDVNADLILEYAGGNRERPVVEVSLDDFFGRLTAVKEWFDESRTARAKKFLELRRLLEESLTALCVYKIGEIQIEIFIAGIDKSGRLAGVRTRAVET